MDYLKPAAAEAVVYPKPATSYQEPEKKKPAPPAYAPPKPQETEYKETPYQPKPKPVYRPRPPVYQEQSELQYPSPAAKKQPAYKSAEPTAYKPSP